MRINEHEVRISILVLGMHRVSLKNEFQLKQINH